MAGNQPDTISLLFTVNETSTVITNYSLYDFTTGNTVTGGNILLMNNHFEIQAAGGGFTYKITGSFTTEDKVEGTYGINYPGYWTVNGPWQGAPQS